MPYNKADMLYDNGSYYKWSARADHDNPYYTRGQDYTQLNRTEGYEVLYFINHLGEKHWPANSRPNLATYQKIERMIRYSVPGDIRTHAKIAEWIVSNWLRVGY